MPRPKSLIPKLCHDRTRDRAFVKVDGKFVSLGKWGSPQAQSAYGKLLEQLATGQELTRQSKPRSAPRSTLTVAELFLAFTTRELPRLSKSENYCFKAAMRVARPFFGQTAADDFGPVKYRLMRDAMVAGDPAAKRVPWSRKTANRQAKRIRAIFRWGASWELVPVEVVQRLDTVRALAIGETDAAEYAPRESVPQTDIDAVRAKLRPHHRDILDLLLLTGARPGEILNLTGKLIERRDDGFWTAELSDHKTARKGKRRLLVFNTEAQSILLRYLKPDPEAKLFALRRDNFAPVIRRACVRAKVTPFVPHQLRHSVATRLYDEVGLEAAQAMLGHSDALMTLHYSRAAEKQAKEAAKRLG